MDFSFKIEGLDKLESTSAAIRQAVADEVAKGTYASAQHVATEYKKSLLEGGKSGRLYNGARSLIRHRHPVKVPLLTRAAWLTRFRSFWKAPCHPS